MNMKDEPAMASEAKKYNVYGNHAYAPESVDLENRTVTLTNPWGKKHVIDMPIAEFMKYYTSIQIGDSIADVGQAQPNTGPRPTTLVGNAGAQDGKRLKLESMDPTG